ncbi:MAG: nicotinamidase [Treponema sp.]|nr:nicotinamidase [Treponema sp.]
MKFDYKTTALLAVDIQNDFCPAYTGKDGKEHPEGALAVKGANEIIAPLNSLAKKIHKKGGKVLLTQDWHPAGHISFADSHRGKKNGDIIIISIPEETVDAFYEKFPGLTDPIPAAMQQILWPVHCLQDSEGASFHDKLDTTIVDFVFRKGYHKNIDSYSGFFENDRCTPTDLSGYLKEQSIATLLVGGIATDYCVLHTAIDALRLGFKTYVISDACMGIDTPAGSINKAAAVMKQRGAIFVSTKDI